MNIINSSDISVVIQGAFSDATALLIKSLRTTLPDSEIILSTWESENFDASLVDKVIRSKDPGATFATVDCTRPFNLNRQIISSKNGIDIATKKYVLKCRSDLYFESDNFLKCWDKFPKTQEEFRVFKHKVIIPSLYTIEAESNGKVSHFTPFHISDWCCFGLKEDIQLLFDIPVINQEEFSHYFLYNKKIKDYPILWLNHRLWQFPPEQYFGLALAKKKFPNITMSNTLDNEKISYEFNCKFLVNNFIVLDNEDYGFYLNKGYYYTISKDYELLPNHIKNSIITTKRYAEISHLYLESRETTTKTFQTNSTRHFDYTIVTPTYKGHFCYIHTYLNSFNKFSTNNDFQICFIIEMEDFEEFCSIVEPFQSKLNIRILFFEQLLRYFKVEESPQKIMEKYGRFSYQTLKKFYAMLYLDSKYYLILDSESMLCKKTDIVKLFKQFFENPVIFYSPRFIWDAKRSLKDLSVENVEYLLNYQTNNWYIEEFSWFYEKEILVDLFEQYGQPIGLIHKIGELISPSKRAAGVFEILLYRIYIEKNHSKYPRYKFIDIYEMLKATLEKQDFLKYYWDSKNTFHGESGFFEHFSLFIKFKSLKHFIKLINNIQCPIVRFESYRTRDYIIQRLLIKKSNIQILAASQDHWHMYPSFRVYCQRSIKFIIHILGKYLKN